MFVAPSAESESAAAANWPQGIATQILHQHVRGLIEGHQRQPIFRADDPRQIAQGAADDLHAAAPTHARRSIDQQHQVQRRVPGMIGLPGLDADLQEAKALAADGRRPARHDQAQALMLRLGEVVIHRRQELLGANAIGRRPFVPLQVTTRQLIARRFDRQRHRAGLQTRTARAGETNGWNPQRCRNGRLAGGSSGQSSPCGTGVDGRERKFGKFVPAIGDTIDVLRPTAPTDRRRGA